MKNRTELMQEVMVAREDQIAKGYDAENDAEHRGGELARAAGAYALAGSREDERTRALGLAMWPELWPDETYKPRLYRDNLLRAGALLLAELERLEQLRGRLQFWWVGESTEMYFAWDLPALESHLKDLGAWEPGIEIRPASPQACIQWDGQQVTLEDIALDFLACYPGVRAHQLVSGYGE